MLKLEINCFSQKIDTFQHKGPNWSQKSLKDDILPETLTPPKIVLPKAKGYYHPLAISFPGFGVF